MHRNVHLIRNKGVVKGFGENPSAQALQGTVLDAITLGLDHSQNSGLTKVLQTFKYSIGLIKGQLAPTGPYSDGPHQESFTLNTC